MRYVQLGAGLFPQSQQGFIAQAEEFCPAAPKHPRSAHQDKNSLNITTDLHWDAETLQFEGPMCCPQAFAQPVRGLSAGDHVTENTGNWKYWPETPEMSSLSQTVDFTPE